MFHIFHNVESRGTPSWFQEFCFWPPLPLFTPFSSCISGYLAKKHSHEKLWKLVGHGMGHGPESISVSTNVGSGSLGSKMAAHSPGSCDQRPLQECLHPLDFS